MDGRLMFSVIIPVHNVENYIRATVGSVLGQQNAPSFEVILVDDGSPDGCPAICDSFAESDTRVRVIHKPNGGEISARKAGAALVQGRYVVCLDGDDLLRGDALSLIASVIGENDSPDVICFGMAETDGTTERLVPIGVPAGLYHREDIEKRIFPILIQSEDASCFQPGVCGKAIRAELYCALQLSQEEYHGIEVTGEDRVCGIACVYRADSVFVLDEPLYKYVENPRSATRRGRVLSWKSPVLINRQIAERVDLDTADFREQLDRKIVHDLFNVALSQFNSGKKYGEIRCIIRQNMREDFFSTAVESANFRHSAKAALMKMVVEKCATIPLFLLSIIRKKRK